MKLKIEIEKKVGLSNYGSSRSIVGIEYDCPDALAQEDELLEQQISHLQNMARRFVDRDLDAQLERQPLHVVPDDDHLSAEPRPADQRPQRASHPSSSPTHVNGKPFDGDPTSGAAFFRWLNGQQEGYDIDLVKYMNQWAKLNDMPYSMKSWNADQVRLGVAEAKRKLSTLPHGAYPR